MLCFLKQDPDPGSGSAFKILICRIRIRPKMDRIRNPAYIRGLLTKLGARVQGGGGDIVGGQILEIFLPRPRGH